MKLKGTQVTGIFNFIKGVVFTAGDIIIDNLTLYNVIADYDGSVPPAESPSCISYIEYHSYAVNPTMDSLVTSNSFNIILKSYFKGLVGNGELESLTISSLDELDLLIDSGAYFIHIDKDVVPSIPEGDYLLRIYTSKDDIIQEFVDYINGFNVYRNVSKGYFTLLPSNTRSGLKKLNENFNELSNRSMKLVSELINLKNSSFNFQKCNISDNTITDVKLDTILHLIILDADPTGDLQYDREFYITNGTSIVSQYITSIDRVQIVYSNNIVKVNMPSKYKLQAAYISKGK